MIQDLDDGDIHLDRSEVRNSCANLMRDCDTRDPVDVAARPSIHYIGAGFDRRFAVIHHRDVGIILSFELHQDFTRPVRLARPRPITEL